MRDANAVPLYSLKNIAKTYVNKEGPVLYIQELNIPRGQMIAVIGFSGSGKTTLLNLLAMLEMPDSPAEPTQRATPSILFCPNGHDNSEELISIPDRQRQTFRATFGFVFQQGYLLENLSCADNIRIPFFVRSLESNHSLIADMMESVRLDKNMSDRPPSELSGGERQRISVLRALGHSPSIVFADEPTSNLDEDNAALVLSRLSSWRRNGMDRTVLLVTHNLNHAAKYADSVILMSRGRVQGPLPLTASGHRLTAAQLSAQLARFSEELDSALPSPETVPTAISEITPRRAQNPRSGMRKFIFSFALSDVFPRTSEEGARGILQKFLRVRNAQFHSMASMFFALVLALFFGGLYSGLREQFAGLISDKRIARIEVLGRQNGERLLDVEDVRELSGLSWASGDGFDGIAAPQEIRLKQLRKKESAVEAAAGYRIRDMHFLRDPTHANQILDSGSNMMDLPVVSTQLSDPVLRKIEVQGSGGNAGKKSETRMLSQVLEESPNSKTGVILTRAALEHLGYTGEVPKTIQMYPPFSKNNSALDVPIVAIVDWLPKSADAMIMEDLFLKLWFEGGSGDNAPRFDSVDVYFADMMNDGIALYSALQRLGYSVSGDRLAFLRWAVSLVRAIRYFSLVAAIGIFGVVMVTLIVSYTEAIRRKEKEIGVLLAYGTPMPVLYAVFFVEVALVWLVAVAFAIPSERLASRAVANLVAQGFQLHGAQAVSAAPLPWTLWVFTLGGSLVVAIGAIVFAMRKVDPKRVAHTLRTPD